ncbi:hypothetical protein SAMN05444392_102346 [Seinonella peptonophila]|uniref:DUF5666 domain-containing protein n=1 Tax=Seinonella peptonophila TaxID=112248 RepID=A0A1M4VFW3_9BACL|nr:hypothetical protein [Seinonella peptonophila]SHE67906.1 hypothetical protein SAMN05444392_102346 [Seinonella peptonophila]
MIIRQVTYSIFVSFFSLIICLTIPWGAIVKADNNDSPNKNIEYHHTLPFPFKESPIFKQPPFVIELPGKSPNSAPQNPAPANVKGEIGSIDQQTSKSALIQIQSGDEVTGNITVTDQSIIRDANLKETFAPLTSSDLQSGQKVSVWCKGPNITMIYPTQCIAKEVIIESH